MGYYSRLSGEIQIDPPLRWSEIKDSRFLPINADLVYRLTVECGEDDNGERTVVRAVAIKPATDQAWKHDDIPALLAEIVAEHPDRRYAGHLIRIGEEQGDVERYRVQDGQVVSEQARIAWPDGTTVGGA